MKPAEILRWRIARHHLGREKGADVVTVARRIGGIHAQAISRPQGWISPTLVVNGRIEGVWEPSPQGPRITAFGRVPAKVRRALPEGAVIV